ncbi:MAG: hypothetical protein KDE27_01905 [Planctomycetes bacterium]|nr:hypothetical protein [Planctomycetota bacterium]
MTALAANPNVVVTELRAWRDRLCSGQDGGSMGEIRHAVASEVGRILRAGGFDRSNEGPRAALDNVCGQGLAAGGNDSSDDNTPAPSPAAGRLRAEPGADQQLLALMEHGKPDLARLVLRVEAQRDSAVRRSEDLASQNALLQLTLDETRAERARAEAKWEALKEAATLEDEDVPTLRRVLDFFDDLQLLPEPAQLREQLRRMVEGLEAAS